MDIISLGLGVAGVVVVPLGTVIGKKLISDSRRLTVLETNHANIDKKLTSVEAKLDRLIERFL